MVIAQIVLFFLLIFVGLRVVVAMVADRPSRMLIPLGVTVALLLPALVIVVVVSLRLHMAD